MIGVIVPDIVTHFYSSIISGIEEVAKEHGYFIVIASSNESLEKEIESVENLLKSRVEGLIVCVSQETNRCDHFERLISTEIPLVFFDRICESLEVPSVIADGIDASEKIVRHFYENGYKRIAYISGPNHLNISRTRKEGYLNGLKECGLNFNPEYLIECDLGAEDATRATKELLSRNDTIAFAAMKEIKKRGLKIPDDIALVGFTDEFHSTVVEPTLTSVTHPTIEMGREAANLFFQTIEKGINFRQQIVLKTELIVRDSSAKIR